MFTDDQLYRYSRHILIPGIGVKGVEKIRKGSVLLIGAGGLGSPIAYYLCAAGIGKLGIVDFDKVDLSNLQRQIIHFTKDVGKHKADSAFSKLNELNPDTEIIVYKEYFNPENAEKLIADYDFIIDACDNFETKFLINDVCVLNNKPFSHAGVLRLCGQTLTHLPGTACYRCVFGEIPEKGSVPSCSEAGVLGSVVGTLGTIQATEALKYISGYGELLTNKLFTMDFQNNLFNTISFEIDSDCPICSKRSITGIIKDNYVPVQCEKK